MTKGERRSKGPPGALSAARFGANVSQSPGTLRLAWLLASFRVRHMRNALRSGHAGRGGKGHLLAGLLIPAAYFMVFMGAFSTVVKFAPPRTQMATLGVVTAALWLAGLLSKIAGADAVRAGTSENQFYLAHPITLWRLMVARLFVNLALDVWGALFLFPVFAGAIWVLGLGGKAFLAAAGISFLAQLASMAWAQAVMVLLVRLIPARRRPLVWTGLSLTSMAVLAGLWFVSSALVRGPASFAEAIGPYAEGIISGPLGVLPRAVFGSGVAGGGGAGLAWAQLVFFAGIGVAALWGAARYAGARGWEDAGDPWAEGQPNAASRRGGDGRAFSLAGKDLRLLWRDRPRLFTLAAMPLLFVGVQVFAVAGHDLFAGGPERLAMLSYSLAAYLGVMGPLTHMQAERRALWLIQTTPLSTRQFMVAKTKAWLVPLCGVAGISFAGLGLAAHGTSFVTAHALQLFALMLVGCVVVTALGVAMGAQCADLTGATGTGLRPTRIYLFLLLGGLFNTTLAIGTGQVVVESLVLYVAVVAGYWWDGEERLRWCGDPEMVAARRVSMGDAVVTALVFSLGGRAIALVTAGSKREEILGILIWLGIIALWAFVGYLRRLPRPWRVDLRWAWVVAVAGGLGFALRLVAGPAGASTGFWEPPGDRQIWVASSLVVGLFSEVVFRGALCQVLRLKAGQRPRDLALAALAAFAIALVANPGPLTAATVVVHVVATGLAFVSRGLTAPLVFRFLLLWPRL